MGLTSLWKKEMKKINALFFLTFFIIFLYSIFTGGFVKPYKDLQNGQRIVIFLKKKYDINILYNLKYYTIEIRINGKINDSDLHLLGFWKSELRYCSNYGKIVIDNFDGYQILKYKNVPCVSEAE